MKNSNEALGLLTERRERPLQEGRPNLLELLFQQTSCFCLLKTLAAKCTIYAIHEERKKVGRCKNSHSLFQQILNKPLLLYKNYCIHRLLC